ncbi:MAG: GDP-mannose 4,6-dehydratase [Smithella sp.]
MKKYLITGFSGFVSRHFLQYLEDNEIRALIKGIDVRSPDFGKENFKHVKFDFEKVNLLNKAKVEDVIFEFHPDYILHLASFSSVAFSWKEPIVSFNNNVNIFLNLLEAVRKLNLSARILSVGSSEEYGNVEEKYLPLRESQTTQPVSPYAVARLSQELISKVYVDGYGLDIVMTRSFNHIGTLQRDVFVIPSFARQMVDIKKSAKQSGELVTGDTSIIRDFTDVRDVVSAYYLLLNEGRASEIYNVCSGVGTSLNEMIRIMGNILDIDVNIRVDRNLIRPNDNKIIIGSNEKIKTELGWHPNITVEQSLNDIIDYWCRQYLGI